MFFCTHVQFSFLFHKKLLELSFSKDFYVYKVTVDMYRINIFEVKLVGKHTIEAFSAFLTRTGVSLIKVGVQVSYVNMPLKQFANYA